MSQCLVPRVPVWTITVVAACTAPVARAHDYYFQQEDDALVLYEGHVQSEHEGDAVVPYDPAIVQEARCVAADGGDHALLLPQSHPARFPADCAVVAVRMSTGYWSQTPEGDVNQPKTAVGGASFAWWSEESIKHIGRWLPALGRPLGDGLELVPLDNPLELEPGDKLRLRVSWRGAPLAGVLVAYDGELRGMTDAVGEINIRLRHGGRQLIAASFEETLAGDARADAAVRTTMLQFQAAE